MIITLKIEDIRPRDHQAMILGEVERFLDRQDPDARVDLKLEVVR
jgi:hypothetical protein